MEREKKIFLETKGVQPDLENQDYIIGRLLKPEARKDIIEYFAEEEIIPTSMMDISDGLSSELMHICKQSNVGCVLYEDKIPIHEQTNANAEKFKIAATTCALNGGEDYELLFTLDTKDFEKASNCPLMSIIGHMTGADAGCHLITTGNHKVKLSAQGWNSLKN